MQIQSLSWEDPLEEGMETHSSVLACRIRMDRTAWRATVHGVANSRTPAGLCHLGECQCQLLSRARLFAAPWTDCGAPGSSVHRSSPGKNTGVDSRSLLQGLFLTQGSDPGLLHCRQVLYFLSHQGSTLQGGLHKHQPRK